MKVADYTVMLYRPYKIACKIPKQSWIERDSNTRQHTVNLLKGTFRHLIQNLGKRPLAQLNDPWTSAHKLLISCWSIFILICGDKRQKIFFTYFLHVKRWLKGLYDEVASQIHKNQYLLETEEKVPIYRAILCGSHQVVYLAGLRTDFVVRICSQVILFVLLELTSWKKNNRE